MNHLDQIPAMTTAGQSKEFPGKGITERFREVFGKSLKNPGLLLVCITVLVANGITMPHHHYRGDAIYVQANAVDLILTGSIMVPETNLEVMGDPGQYYVQNTKNGKWYSKYGLINTFLYVPPLLAEKWVVGRLDYNYLSGVRICMLNGYMILWSVLIAVYLWKIFSFYSSSSAVKYSFVVAVFYATYVWYYLRTTGMEIFQLLFFLGFYYNLVAYKNGKSAIQSGSRWIDWNLFGAIVFLACLCMAKLVYLLLAPVLMVFVLLVGYGHGIKLVDHLRMTVWSNIRCYLFSLVIPLAAMLVLVVYVNDCRFGSPLNTGYQQWRASRQLFSGNLWVGLHGLLVSGHGSVFLYFPVLVLSLFGVAEFVKKHAWDYSLTCVIFILFLLVHSKFCDWHGSWGLGPRFMVFILPVLSLPFIEVLERIVAARRGDAKTWMLCVLSVVLLTGSAYFQVNVNALECFASEELGSMFWNAGIHNRNDAIRRYFGATYYGVICRDFIAYKEKGTPWFPLEQLRQSDKAEYVPAIENGLKLPIFSCNYWFLKSSGR